MEHSPVVRLRDGTAVPKVPSQVHRRGRSFGWICETLEGSSHLLITGALDSKSRLADWIVKDYEDNLYLSTQYGYTIDDFEGRWFSRGGMSMQACLLLDVEPYLYRDEPMHALRALFNAQSVSYFPDVRMNTEHAAPYFDDWCGDHFKSSDEANSCGWLRYLLVREQDEQTPLIGQAVPRAWLKPGQRCGLERTATWFGLASVSYTGGEKEITCELQGPTRNPSQGNPPPLPSAKRTPALRSDGQWQAVAQFPERVGEPAGRHRICHRVSPLLKCELAVGFAPAGLPAAGSLPFLAVHFSPTSACTGWPPRHSASGTTRRN